MSKLQKDENGRVFFFDGSMVSALGSFTKFLMGVGPDPRICYLDAIQVTAQDDEPYVDERYGIRWKRAYTPEQIEEMWRKEQEEEEIKDYGVTAG
jgi:hypothetical protein